MIEIFPGDVVSIKDGSFALVYKEPIAIREFEEKYIVFYPVVGDFGKEVISEHQINWEVTVSLHNYIYEK